MRQSLLTLLLFSSFSSLAAEDFYRNQIKKRIEPIGQVRVQKELADTEKEASLSKESQTQQVAEKIPGAQIYEQYCSTCHRNGLAGAPKYRDEADWKARMDEKNMDTMVSNAIKGINAMPPKGTCMSCSEEDIRLAVEYMVPR